MEVFHKNILFDQGNFPQTMKFSTGMDSTKTSVQEILMVILQNYKKNQLQKT